MPRRAEGSQGDGPLLTFSRNLEAAIKGLPADFEHRMTISQGEPGILSGIEGGLGAFGLGHDGIGEIVAAVRESYTEQLIKDLVKRDLMGGRDYIRSSRDSFKGFGAVRTLEFNSGTCKKSLGHHGEGEWTPATSRILGAQILHRFSVDSQTSGESVFRWAVVEMPETRCEFRSEPGNMGDNIDVAFISRAGAGRRVWVRDTRLLGISKGAGGVKWAQNLTFPEFGKGLADAVSRTIAQG